MRVLYNEIDICKDCPMNRCRMCYELGRPLKEISFDADCPLPTLNIVESYTRYITNDKSLEACGNCRNWTRWGYNKNLKTEIGICNKENFLKFVSANGSSCEEFEDVGGRSL